MSRLDDLDPEPVKPPRRTPARTSTVMAVCAGLAALAFAVSAADARWHFSAYLPSRDTVLFAIGYPILAVVLVLGWLAPLAAAVFAYLLGQAIGNTLEKFERAADRIIERG